MQDLNPCPFCGNLPQVSKEGIAMHACRVLDREIRVPVAAWNRRVERTCHMDITEEGEGRYRMWECGECGHSCEDVFGSYEYCPHCGAKVVVE